LVMPAEEGNQSVENINNFKDLDSPFRIGGTVNSTKEFRFVTEKIFSIPGRGTVVSGRVEKGAVSVGEEIAFIATDGSMIRALVLAIEVSRRLVEEVEASQQASLLLEGPRKDQIAIGTIFMEAPEAPAAPISYAPAAPLSPSPSVPSISSYGGPIHPSSSSWRTILFILLGILILLAILFLQGEWDPRKKLTTISDPQSAGAKIHQTLWDEHRG
jgi:hypothetical protein